MRIERSKPGDAQALTAVAFGAKRSWGYPESWIEAWRPVLTLTPEYIRANPTYCAVEAGGIVGFFALRLGGAEATLDHLWVAPAAEGRGVGRSLFRHCEETARQAGARLLRIESDPHAEGFYHAMGAVTVGRGPAAMDGGERFLPLLERRL